MLPIHYVSVEGQFLLSTIGMAENMCNDIFKNRDFRYVATLVTPIMKMNILHYNVTICVEANSKEAYDEWMEYLKINRNGPTGMSAVN